MDDYANPRETSLPGRRKLSQLELLKKRFVKLIGLAMLGVLTVVPVERFTSAKINGFQGGILAWLSQRTLQEWLNPGVVWFLFVLFFLWLLNWRIALMWLRDSSSKGERKEQHSLSVPISWRTRLLHWIKSMDWRGFLYQEVCLGILWIILTQVDRFVNKGASSMHLNPIAQNIPNLATNPMFVLPLPEHHDYAHIFFTSVFIMYHIMWLASALRGFLKMLRKSTRLLSILMQALLIANSVMLYVRFDPPPAGANRFKLTIHSIVHILLYLNSFFLFGFHLRMHNCIVDEENDPRQENQGERFTDSLSNAQIITTVILLPVTPLIIPDMSSGFVSIDRTYLEPVSRIFYELGAYFWQYWFYNFFATQFRNGLPRKFERVWRFLYSGQLYLYLLHSMWLYVLVYFVQAYYFYVAPYWKYLFLQVMTPTMCYLSYYISQCVQKVLKREQKRTEQ